MKLGEQIKKLFTNNFHMYLFLLAATGLFLSMFFFSPFITGTLGLFLVVIGAMWGIKGGLMAASWSGLIMILVFFSPQYLSVNGLLSGLTAYLVLGSFLGIIKTNLSEKQKEIRKQKDLLEGVLNGISDIIGVHHSDLTIERYNKAGYEQLQMTEEEVKGKKCYELLGRQTECPGCATRKALTSKELETSEKYFAELDRYLDCRSNPILNEKGEVVWIVEQLRDITEQKMLEKERDRLIREQELLLDNIDIQIWYLLDQQTHGRANQARADFLGIDLEDLENKNYHEIYDRETAQSCIENNREVFAKKEKVYTESQVENSRGEKRILAITKNPCLNEKNEIDYVVCSAYDITESKQNEARVQKYTAELEELNDKLDQEINKAVRIHEKSLPGKIPEVEGVSMTAYYLPAERLGGDFYDIIQYDDRLIMYVSDVTGHGLEAAILSNFVKNTINAYVYFHQSRELTPAGILRFLLRQYQQENYPEDYFICISVVILDLATGEISYKALGLQDPLLLKRAQGQLEELRSRGLPISGTVPLELLDLEYRQTRLLPGDTLLINTDGITEQRNNNGEYYLERFKKVFSDHGHQPPAIFANTIRQDFSRFNGNREQGDDDITYLLAQIQPEDRTEYRLEIESSRSGAKRLRRRLKEIIPSSYSGDMIAMGIYELAANAIKHGHKYDQKQKVVIEIILTGEYIYAVIEDNGQGFNWQDKLEEPFNLWTNSENGRGLMMTSRGCDEVIYNKEGNKAFLLKYR